MNSQIMTTSTKWLKADIALVNKIFLRIFYLKYKKLEDVKET